MEDAAKLTDWLATNVAHAERNPDRVRQELLARCRQVRVEPPTPARVTRMVRSALATAEETWFARIKARCGPEVRARVLALIAPEGDDQDDDGEVEAAGSVLASIKTMPGNVSLESMLVEVGKLRAVRAVGLPAGVFARALIVAIRRLTQWDWQIIGARVMTPGEGAEFEAWEGRDDQ